jgi:hypothetical protein
LADQPAEGGGEPEHGGGVGHRLGRPFRVGDIGRRHEGLLRRGEGSMGTPPGVSVAGRGGERADGQPDAVAGRVVRGARLLVAVGGADVDQGASG